MVKFIFAFLLIFLVSITPTFASTASTENEILETRGFPELFTITVQRTPDGTKFVRVEGTFEYMFGYNLANILDLHPDAEYLEMYSTGGNLEEMNEPAKRLASLGIPVVVRSGEYCVSACAYLALASPDIRIEGQLAFHLPYSGGFPLDTTLYEVSQDAVLVTLMMNRFLFEHDWKLILYFLIQSTTDAETYVVFESEEELYKFKFDEPEEFTAVTEEIPFFNVRTGPEIDAFAVEQRKK
jgi:hypothetical protein